MIEENVKFIEKYKQIDKICKDMFNSREGVSEYLAKMEETPYSKKQKCYYFDDFYKQLKHFRWIRNQLAHEQSIDSDFCSEDDINWLEDFYDDLLSCNDPLAAVYKEENVHKKSSNTKREVVRKQEESEENFNYVKNGEKKEKLSLWKRIVSKIKSWFS